jgi:hypothetical protein
MQFHAQDQASDVRIGSNSEVSSLVRAVSCTLNGGRVPDDGSGSAMGSAASGLGASGAEIGVRVEEA